MIVLISVVVDEKRLSTDLALLPNCSISWAWLQEGVTTTPYANNDGSTEMWKFPVFLLTVQSILSSITGSLYLWWSTPRGQPVPPIIPTNRMLPALILVAFTQALAAPFGMASLAHVNYITFTLAKSCKLLPVMFLHVTLFRRRYPLQKYLIVAAVTAGVAVFTLHSGSKKHKSGGAGPTHSGQTAWGMLLLSINLLFDGLTNSTQDYIVSEFKPYRGPQMMCANNMMSSALSGAYLLLSPYLVRTALGEWFGMADVAGGGELYAALGFLARHPGAWWHVLGFGLCGAVGQVFICRFSGSPFLICKLPLPGLLLTHSSSSRNSLHRRQLWLRHPRHRDRHPQDAHHDPVCRVLRPQLEPQAVDGRRARVWGHRLRGVPEEVGRVEEGR